MTNRQPINDQVHLKGLLMLAICTCLLTTGCTKPSPTVPSDSEQQSDANRKAAEVGIVENLDKPNTNPEESVERVFWQQMNAETTGVTGAYQNGEAAEQCTILESLGGGIGIIDFDRDGRMDVCLPGGGGFTNDQQVTGLPTFLYQNRDQWMFHDRSDASRIAYSPFYSHGVAVGDYNNDGFSDLVITGYQGILLWTNQGDGTFIESALTLGIYNPAWASSAAWGDLTGDGNLDLYVANYVDWSFQNHPVCTATNRQRDICPPKSFAPLADQLFVSQGDGQFADQSASSGLRSDGKGLGVLLADVNADARLDIYVANDTTNNFLYLNDGGSFTELGELSGVALDDRGLPNGSMGLDAFDYNQDGHLDVWVCNYEDEAFGLYRNDGDSHFLHVSKSTGLTSFGQRFVGFGTAAVDFDLDGDEDVVVANGHVIKYPQRSPRKQLPLFLENQQGRFHRVNFANDSYFAQPHEGRGLAVADFDNDGDVDIAISHVNAPMALLQNKTTAGDWLSIQLVGIQSNRDAIGATVWLHTNDGNMLRQIKGGGSYLSTPDLRLHWGFSPQTQIEKLEIVWPSGVRQTIDNLIRNNHLVVGEPDS